MFCVQAGLFPLADWLLQDVFCLDFRIIDEHLGREFRRPRETHKEVRSRFPEGNLCIYAYRMHIYIYNINISMHILNYPKIRRVELSLARLLGSHRIPLIETPDADEWGRRRAFQNARSLPNVSFTMDTDDKDSTRPPSGGSGSGKLNC